ncbi:hypothetical protein T11_12970 [Trichinella zimbabwensis]|uniref:Uncharacterized protein n=1 Tax=Trichinella zimbabwensis TaxID=268475 RepID=A0A0V1DLN7_9BILA|nr:hypothetical protein T11_12970 [Trichinella zimbabwensis]
MLDIADVSFTYGQIQPLLLTITTNSGSVAANHIFA